MTQKLIKALIIVSLLASCGKNGTGDEVIDSSIIVEDLDWKEVADLREDSPIYKNSRSIADITIPAVRSRCTGFLISKNVLMTNQHCVTEAANAKGVSVTFDHVGSTPREEQKRFDCSEFIGNNRELDFALLRCKGNPGNTYGFVELSSKVAEAGDAIYVVQQNCDYFRNNGCDWNKKFSTGEIVEIDANDSYFHSADTLGGSSGSPVFLDRTNKVTAIHHVGIDNDGVRDGRGLINLAVPMSKIVPYIKRNFPQVKLPQSSGEQELTRNEFKESPLIKVPSKKRGLISSSKDIDVFRVVIKKKIDISVAIRFSHKRGDLNLYLLDEKEKILAKSEFSTSSKSFEFIQGEIKKGRYFIAIRGNKGAKGKYELFVREKKD